MKYDFIVVGGGSAGCVTAARLVSRYGARVLLLEAGWPDTSALIHMPAGFVKMLFKPGKFVTHYRTEPQPQLGGRSIDVLQANVLGGGSSVNAMTYTRGTKADYDSWDQALGGKGWNWESILPYFIRQEGNQRLGAPLHGTAGPLKVSDAHHPPSEISRSFLLALQAAGVPYTPDFNCGDERGAGYLQSTTYRGRRCSAAKAFLAPLSPDQLLTIKYRAPVLKVILEGDRAIGVEYADSNAHTIQRALATTEIVLCAGAFISPKILMLSGIGPAADLKRLSIKVVSDLPGVGQNMQDHNDASLLIETTANYGYSGEDRGLRMFRNGLQYLMFGSGPVASTGSEVTAFLDPKDLSAPPTIQFYCMGTIYPSSEKPNPPPGMTLIANLVAPQSRGRMQLRSASPSDPPLINPNWLSEKRDQDSLVAGVRFLLRTMDQPPLKEKIAKIHSPVSESSSDEEVAEHCRKVTTTNWHPVGSCRMGREQERDTVVDAYLKVLGVRGLRVFDGSIMPQIIRANTNAPIMAIAEKGVDLMMCASPPSLGMH